jgi:hypothetical protein
MPPEKINLRAISRLQPLSRIKSAVRSRMSWAANQERTLRPSVEASRRVKLRGLYLAKLNWWRVIISCSYI